MLAVNNVNMLNINLIDLKNNSHKGMRLVSSEAVMFKAKLGLATVDVSISVLEYESRSKICSNFVIKIDNDAWFSSKKTDRCHSPSAELFTEIFGDFVNSGSCVYSVNSMLWMIAKELCVEETYVHILNSVPSRSNCDGNGKTFCVTQ